MSFNKTETNKLEINRKYVAVAVRVSTEMNKRYTKILLAIERNGTLERRKKKRKNRLGLFLLYNFFLVVAAFLLLFFFVVFLYIFFEPASLCRVRGFRLIFPPLHSIWQTHGNNAIEQIKYKRKKKYGTFEPLVMAFPFSQKDSKYQCRTYKTLLNEIKHTNVTSA